MPSWVAGISIGAINSAIIAGNPPERRVERLRAVLGTRVEPPDRLAARQRRQFAQDLQRDERGAGGLGGVPGFFEPRVPPAVFMPPGTPEAISVYDTAPLYGDARELVDFDLLNSGAVRLQRRRRAGAHRQHEVFRHRHAETIGARAHHGERRAAARLSAGRDRRRSLLGRRSRLQHAAAVRARRRGHREDMCVFQIDLFSAKGRVPRDAVRHRRSARRISATPAARGSTPTSSASMQTMRRAIRRLRRDAARRAQGDDPTGSCSTASSCDAAITIVQLIHRRAVYSTQSNDYEFSRYTIDEHWRDGREDVGRTLSHPSWKNRERPEEGVTVLDLTARPRARSQGDVAYEDRRRA